MKFSEIRSLQDLIKKIEIPDTWDYLLVGDGSGNLWEHSAGWCSSLISQCGWRRCFYGGFSHGTNNVAELMAYAAPLWWLAEGNEPPDRPVVKGAKTPIRFVHIVSDSRYVVDGFNGKTTPKANIELWGALRAVQRRGLILKAHWIPRATIRFNKLADQVAGECRLALANRVTKTTKGDEVSVQTYCQSITQVRVPQAESKDEA
jgi:ribonuclease HI